MIKPESISNILDPRLQGSGIFVTEIVVKSGNRIMVHIDGDNYVTVDDCIHVSKMIESELNRDQEDFELQVSSPGADQPLKLPRQFPKNVGKKIEVVTHAGMTITGTLAQATPYGISIQPVQNKKDKTPPQVVEMAYSDLEKAKCIISFK